MGRILVVDDEQDILVLMQSALGAYGHDVTGAVSGIEAMDFLAQEAPDLLILDLRMPDITGLELLEWVRGRHAALPIIICSALSGLRDDFAVWNSRVAAFVPKPIDITRLVTEVARALGASPGQALSVVP